MSQELLKWVRSQKGRRGALKKTCFDAEKAVGQYDSDAEYFLHTSDPAMFLGGLAVRCPEKAAELAFGLRARNLPVSSLEPQSVALFGPSTVPLGYRTPPRRRPRYRPQEGIGDLLRCSVLPPSDEISDIVAGRVHPLTMWGVVMKMIHSEVKSRQMTAAEVAAEMMQWLRERVDFEEWLRDVRVRLGG